VFSTTRRLLVDELGVEPGAALLDAYRDVLDRDAPIESVRTAVSTGPQRGLAPAQLPAASRNFIGRSDEIARLCDYLSADAQAGHGPTVAAVTGTEGWERRTLAVHGRASDQVPVPGRQLFVDLRGVGGRPAPVEQVLEQFLVSLGHAADSAAGAGRRARRPVPLGDGARAVPDRAGQRHRHRADRAAAPRHPTAAAVIVTSRRFLTDLDGALPVRIATSARTSRSPCSGRCSVLTRSTATGWTPSRSSPLWLRASRWRCAWAASQDRGFDRDLGRRPAQRQDGGNGPTPSSGDEPARRPPGGVDRVSTEHRPEHCDRSSSPRVAMAERARRRPDR